VAVAAVPRIPPESVDPRVKNYHWLDLVAGMFEAYERDAENVILTDGAGNVAEGPGFNVFAVKGGAVATPERGVLEGITRQSALELCAELGVAVRVGPLPVAELRAADEVFLTSTAGGIVPVAVIDGRPVGAGAPGPFTRRLTELYWAKHSDPAWTTPV
jgi:branched-chain amino acid aminotransferase